MFSLLKNNTYIRYWLAVVISFLGDALARITIIYLVSRLTTDYFMIGLVIFMQFFPSALLGFMIGPLIDRLPKRWLMIGSDLARLIIVLAMIPARESIWLLLALVFLEGVGKAIFEIARIASVPKLVGKQNIPKAVALFQSTVQTINVIGPMLAGILLALDNVSLIFIINAVSFLLSAILVNSITILKEDGEQPSPYKMSYAASLRKGTHDVASIRVLRFLLLYLIPVTLVIGLFTTNFNALLLQSFRVSPLDFGFLESAFASGAIVGAAAGSILFRHYLRPSFLLFFSTALLGIVMITAFPIERLQSSFGLLPVYGWCILTGLSSALYNVPLNTMFMQRCPEHLVGRGMALLQAVFNICYMIGVLCGGWAASNLGTAQTIAVGGAALLAAVFIFLLNGRFSDMDNTVDPETELQGTTVQKTL